jgi:hypothetical protein
VGGLRRAFGDRQGAAGCRSGIRLLAVGLKPGGWAPVCLVSSASAGLRGTPHGAQRATWSGSAAWSGAPRGVSSSRGSGRGLIVRRRRGAGASRPAGGPGRSGPHIGTPGDPDRSFAPGSAGRGRFEHDSRAPGDPDRSVSANPSHAGARRHGPRPQRSHRPPSREPSRGRPMTPRATPTSSPRCPRTTPHTPTTVRAERHGCATPANAHGRQTDATNKTRLTTEHSRYIVMFVR